MVGVYEENIIPIKISQLAEYVSKMKRISLDDALVYIYVNPMYEKLYDERAKWWYLSTEALYEEFERWRERTSDEVLKEAFEFFGKEKGSDAFLVAHCSDLAGLSALSASVFA